MQRRAKRKSIDTIAVLSKATQEPIEVSRETMASSVELKGRPFHHANSPGGHRRLHVESDGNPGPAVRGEPMK